MASPWKFLARLISPVRQRFLAFGAKPWVWAWRSWLPYPSTSAEDGGVGSWRPALCFLLCLSCNVNPSRLAKDTGDPIDPAARWLTDQLLMAIRLTCDCAFSLFGKVTVSTPFLKRASTWSSLTSTPSGMRRSKRP